jgi:hypothetical protein
MQKLLIKQRERRQIKLSWNYKIIDYMNRKELEEHVNGVQFFFEYWHEVLPFELPFFKEFVEKNYDLSPIYNDHRIFEDEKDYEGAAPLFTKDKLIDYLSEQTLDILEQFNYSKISKTFDIGKEQYLEELLHYEKRLLIKKLKQEYIEEDISFVSILQNWVIDEKNYLTKELPLIQGILNSKSNSSEIEKKTQKIPVKWYALLHFVKIEAGIEKNVRLNANDQFVKSEIISLAEDYYGFKKGQAFYTEFKKLRESKPELIPSMFGKFYKEKLIKLSQNDSRIIKALKNFPN